MRIAADGGAAAQSGGRARGAPAGRCRAAAAERSDSPTGTRRSRRVRTDGAAESQRRPEVCAPFQLGDPVGLDFP